MTSSTRSPFTSVLAASLALSGLLPAAVVTSGFVQNKVVNWSQQPGASASQSTNASGGVASRGIDNNRSGTWGNDSVTHTNNAALDGWFQVDLGSSRAITDINLYNRTDCCGGRLSNYSVIASNDPTFATTVYDSGNQGAAGASVGFSGLSTTAQYVRVRRDGTSGGAGEAISLAEVDILGTGQYSYPNLAIGSTASQSSTLGNAATPTADKAVDGNTENSFNVGSTTHTTPGAGGSVFWETTLTSLSQINEIALYNRGDCCPDRLSNFRVSIFDGTTEVWGENYFETEGHAGEFLIERTFAIQEDEGGFIANGDRVRIELIGGVNNSTDAPDVLSLREVEIYGLAIPEPSSLAMLALAGLGLIRRKR
ncbi:discoidin domain-containing protein [Verrucomicrobiaceae bacterium 227]